MFKHVFLSTLSAFLAFALAACATPTPTPAPPPVPKGGGGEFRTALRADPTTLNPNLTISDDGASNVGQNLFNKLVTLDADYRVVPDLAETWQVSEDGLTYTFQLAKNVLWHDGQPLTSADVKWTFEAIAKSKSGVQNAAMRVVAIETPDANTVEMKLKEVYSPFIANVAWVGFFILPKHLYDGTDWTKNPANEKPVGTGAFKFVEWVKGAHITLEANKRYFKRGPFLDRVTYRIYKDVSAVVADALLKGELDHMPVPPPNDRIPELQKSGTVQVKTFPNPGRYYMNFNLQRKPFDDLRVRQAVNMAINRSALVEKALLGFGTPGVGLYTPAVAWAYNPQARVPEYDASGAEKLLEQAGLVRQADGTRLKLTLVTVNFTPYKELAQNIQEQLRAVGITVDAVTLPAADFTKRVNTDRDFDLALLNGAHGPDPENLNLRFGTGQNTNTSGYSSAEFDAVLLEGSRKTKLEERIKSYFRAQEILARDLPLVPLVELVQFITFRDGVTGLPQTEARGFVTFQDYSLVRVKR